jgi:hypothetical protein
MSQRYEQVGVAVTCRSYEEYLRMFDLQERELTGRLLDIAGGASSFTADAVMKELDAYAADPRYALDGETLVKEAREEIAASTAKLEKLTDKFDFGYYGSLANHRAQREASLERFAAHIADPAVRERRYAAGALPKLPFDTDAFDIVLCSHFLFLYEEQFDYAFHRDAVIEMMRICRPGGTIRVYPIMSLGWTPYAHMDELLEAIRGEGGSPGFFKSKLPFIPGSELGLFINL